MFRIGQKLPSNTLGEQFSTRVVLPLVVIIVSAMLLVAGFLVLTAEGQNRIAIESSVKLASTALQVKQREMARNLQDYAVWEDVFRNLAQEVNFDWASTDGNVGANIFDGLGYDFAAAISPDDKVVYSVVEGVPSVGPVPVLPEGLDDLVQQGRNADQPVVGYLRYAGNVMVVTAAPIIPASMERSAVPVAQRSSLVFGKTVNAAMLDRIGEDYLLSDLRLVGKGDKVPAASVAMVSAAGETLGTLAWTPDLPGSKLLTLLLPPIGGALIVLGALAWFVVRNARRSTKALADSARTVEAYAQTLKDSEERFRDVAEASSDWIWETDQNLELIYFSSRFAQVTGMAAATVLGKTVEAFFFSDGTDGWTKLQELTRARAQLRDLRCSYRDVEGRNRICRVAGRPIINENGEFRGYRGTSTDITEEVEAQALANHLALHDALTGLPNRVLFRDRLNVALEQHEKKAAKTAVLCLDLDHFKEVNDTLGHGAGDELLKMLAERLKACVQSTDTVARLGGDEFAVVQLGVNQPVQVAALSRKIMDVVRAPFVIDGQELYVGVSIGVAIPENLTDDPERLLKNADIALYRAKQAGRGTVRFFESQMDLELQARKALEYDLRQALLKDELEVHYQPLIDMEGRTVAAVEALLRWRHPTRGLVSPGEFIPLAEETGLIVQIGEWVLRTACTEVQQWPGLRVAVNLSPVQFRNRDLVEQIKQVLKETGLEAPRLELEITESILINDTKTALGVLSNLKDLGVNIAMDDFGTGYSSLGYLNSFPFDKIKIDQSFISSMSDTGKSTAIVKSVISLGQSLSMTTTAEGVETLEQATFLRTEGCKQAQGFFFGRPVPAAELTTFLSSWTGFEFGEKATDAA